MSLVATPFARKAVLTAAAAVAVADNASLLVAPTTETVALIRTASGATFTVPSADTVMDRLGVAAKLAGAKAIPPINAAAVARIPTFLTRFVFMTQFL